MKNKILLFKKGRGDTFKDASSTNCEYHTVFKTNGKVSNMLTLYLLRMLMHLVKGCS